MEEIVVIIKDICKFKEIINKLSDLIDSDESFKNAEIKIFYKCIEDKNLLYNSYLDKVDNGGIDRVNWYNIELENELKYGKSNKRFNF